jgi:hypothetical protein
MESETEGPSPPTGKPKNEKMQRSGGIMKAYPRWCLLLATSYFQQLTIPAVLGAPEGALIDSVPGFSSDVPLPSAHYGGWVPSLLSSCSFCVICSSDDNAHFQSIKVVKDSQRIVVS